MGAVQPGHNPRTPETPEKPLCGDPGRVKVPKWRSSHVLRRFGNPGYASRGKSLIPDLRVQPGIGTYAPACEAPSGQNARRQSERRTSSGSASLRWPG